MKPRPADHPAAAHPSAALTPEVAATPDAGNSPHISPDDERLDLIAEAHTRVLDTIDGFEKLVEKADPEFRPVAQAFLKMHGKHETELAVYLARCGRSPQEVGSFFGTVNRAVIEMRSWFEEVSVNVMDRVAEGENHALEAYEQARAAGQTVEAHAMLTRHISDIEALLRRHAR